MDKNIKIFSLIVFIAMILYNCQNVKSDDKRNTESAYPLEVGIVWKYKNITYHQKDTISNIDTMQIAEKYKNYFILKGFMGTNLVKYKNDKIISYGSINNSDTILYDNPQVLGFMDGRSGYIDSDSLKIENNLRTRDSLTVSIIPKYNILGKIDTVYKNTYKASCPNLSLRSPKTEKTTALGVRVK